jgi:hypothetical protein
LSVFEDYETLLKRQSFVLPLLANSLKWIMAAGFEPAFLARGRDPLSFVLQIDVSTNTHIKADSAHHRESVRFMPTLANGQCCGRMRSRHASAGTKLTLLCFH